MSNLCAKCLTRIPKDRTYCKDCDDSARGMFEELGYELFEDDNENLSYRYESGRVVVYIMFNKTRKDFSNLAYLDGSIAGSTSMKMGTLKAINKQVEELGWLDE